MRMVLLTDAESVCSTLTSRMHSDSNKLLVVNMFTSGKSSEDRRAVAVGHLVYHRTCTANNVTDSISRPETLEADCSLAATTCIHVLHYKVRQQGVDPVRYKTHSVQRADNVGTDPLRYVKLMP